MGEGGGGYKWSWRGAYIRWGLQPEVFCFWLQVDRPVTKEVINERQFTVFVYLQYADENRNTSPC